MENAPEGQGFWETERSLSLVHLKRQGEYACLSDDQGRTWDVANEIKLTGHWSADIGYPSSVQLPDGSILTAYYQSEREGEPPCLMGTLWRVVKP